MVWTVLNRTERLGFNHVEAQPSKAKKELRQLVKPIHTEYCYMPTLFLCQPRLLKTNWLGQAQALDFCIDWRIIAYGIKSMEKKNDPLATLPEELRPFATGFEVGKFILDVLACSRKNQYIQGITDEQFHQLMGSQFTPDEIESESILEDIH